MRERDPNLMELVERRFQISLTLALSYKFEAIVDDQLNTLNPGKT